MIRVAAALALVAGLGGCVPLSQPLTSNRAEVSALRPDPSVRRAIGAAMDESAAGWNSGDMDRFLAIYARESEPTFVTSEGLLRGLASLEERYRATYRFDDPAALGTLSFEPLVFRQLSSTYVHYIARYVLTYADGTSASGITTLLFVREAGGWKIVADHSS